MMLTAHRTLGVRLGTYGRGWDILDGDGNLVAHVTTKAEAQRIIIAQHVTLPRAGRVRRA